MPTIYRIKQRRFRLVVFKINLPEEGEEGHWYECPLAEAL
jgi:hypothetical protein